MQYRFEMAVDLSVPLSNDMPVYPGDPSPLFRRVKTLENDGVNITSMTLGSHTGTHLDAPLHFIEGGRSVDRIPVGSFASEGTVVDLSRLEAGSGVTVEDLGGQLKSSCEGRVIVVYTGCSERWGDASLNSNYTYLTDEAAEFLVGSRARGVGIDFLSVEKFGAAQPSVHRTLLGAGLFIIESLNSRVKEFVGRRFLLVAAPLRLANGDAAPCRALAVPITD